ncbi:MAG: DUF2188 domain-containing protein [Luteibacter sp.]
MRIILYLPYNAAPRGQWMVRRNSDLAGQFATREEALRHASRLVAAIRSQPGQDADIKIEDENGNWRYAAVHSEIITAD